MVAKHLTLLVTRIFPIILIIGLAWGQDEYPYFKDMGKQLKFEQKRIYIGYDDGYEITRNGKIISELDFLYTLGLKEEADSLNSLYKKEMSDYLSDVYDETMNDILAKDQVELKFDKPNYIGRKLLSYTASSLFGVIALVMINDEYLKPVAILPAGLSLGSGLIGLFTKKENYMIEVKKKKKLKEKKELPILEKFFTVVQIKSMAEAYNRKLFDDIAR